MSTICSVILSIMPVLIDGTILATLNLFTNIQIINDIHLPQKFSQVCCTW